MMMAVRIEEHRTPPAASLFCKPAVECEHSGPAISLEARDLFTQNFVETFAAAITEARHLPHGHDANEG